MPTARDEQDGECDGCAPTDGRRKCTLSVLCISDSTPRLPALDLATTLAQAVAIVLAPATSLVTSHAAWVMISVLPSLRTAGLGSVKEHFSTSKIEDGNGFPETCKGALQRESIRLLYRRSFLTKKVPSHLSRAQIGQFVHPSTLQPTHSPRSRSTSTSNNIMDKVQPPPVDKMLRADI